MMPDNEAEIIEAAWAAYTSHVMDFFTYDPELTRRLRESVESAVLAASPIERLQARHVQRGGWSYAMSRKWRWVFMAIGTLGFAVALDMAIWREAMLAGSIVLIASSVSE